MSGTSIYEDIALRTGGDIYIGVVGPVRTGKSTFIKKFMDLLVIPKIENPYSKERAKDELPQSANGKTVMTTEPKFVPNEAVEVSFGDNINAKVRMIDCVGYMVEGAEGDFEGEEPRLINTPWDKEPVPFKEAAEKGTEKVISEHSTIGVVVTTDGTISDIPRENYIEAEERVINELKNLNKPFIVLLNSAKAYSDETEELRQELSKKYDVNVMTVNAASLKTEDINRIMENILYEFPVKEIHIDFPKWTDTLEDSHWLKASLIETLKQMLENTDKLNGIKDLAGILSENPYIKKTYVEGIDSGEGRAKIYADTEDNLFYDVLSEELDLDIKDDYALVSIIKKFSELKNKYEKVENALNEVETKGYGIVSPLGFEEVKLERPSVYKQGQKYGVKIKAQGDMIHLIKSPVKAEISPIVGTEEQSQAFIEDVLKDFENSPEKLWDLNIFGRTLGTIVSENINQKVYSIPEDVRTKLGITLDKIVNEGKGGLICILL
ncbi:MAG: stage IV sporulation protein A [Firmicutes bacterium]|nr:stage IV sporulation protein A [Bacillota bacterium]